MSKQVFVNDVSDIIALEAWKDPSIIPDLSGDRSIFVFSDYSSDARILPNIQLLRVRPLGCGLLQRSSEGAPR